MRLRVTPRRARVGRRTAFRFRVTNRDARPVEGATVRFAGARARTDSTGSVTMVRTLDRSGTFTARASKAGTQGASARVTALRQRGRGGPSNGRCDPQRREQRGGGQGAQRCQRIGAG